MYSLNKYKKDLFYYSQQYNQVASKLNKEPAYTFS